MFLVWDLSTWKFEIYVEPYWCACVGVDTTAHQSFFSPYLFILYYLHCLKTTKQYLKLMAPYLDLDCLKLLPLCTALLQMWLLKKSMYLKKQANKTKITDHIVIAFLKKAIDWLHCHKLLKLRYVSNTCIKRKKVEVSFWEGNWLLS